MKFNSLSLKLAIVFLGLCSVLAHARVFVGVGVGVGFNVGPYPYGAYAYPAYPAYPTYLVPAYPATTYVTTPTVIESQPVLMPSSTPIASPATTASQVWYFCEKSNTYYPYVQTCEAPWKTVPATPPKP